MHGLKFRLCSKANALLDILLRTHTAAADRPLSRTVVEQLNQLVKQREVADKHLWQLANERLYALQSSASSSTAGNAAAMELDGDDGGLLQGGGALTVSVMAQQRDDASNRRTFDITRSTPWRSVEARASELFSGRVRLQFEDKSMKLCDIRSQADLDRAVEAQLARRESLLRLFAYDPCSSSSSSSSSHRHNHRTVFQYVRVCICRVCNACIIFLLLLEVLISFFALPCTPTSLVL